MKYLGRALGLSVGKFLRIASTIVLSASPLFAFAESTFPAKPIRIVVDTQAGGAPDKIARAFGKHISEKLGQPVVVDNRPGGSGVISGELVSNAAPDGYTLLLCQSSLAIIPSMMKGLRFDPVKDLAPVTKLVNLKHFLLASSQFKPDTIPQIIEAAQAAPLTINFATIGPATPQRMAMEVFMRDAKIQLTQINYSGAPPLLVALTTNESQLAAASISTGAPFVRSGKMKAIAVLGTERSDAFPELPTFKELGYANVPTPWVGVFAPSGTPANVLAALNEAFASGMKDPSLQEIMRADGIEPVANSASTFAKEFKDEVASIRQLVKAMNLKTD